MSNIRSRDWVFTINNPEENDKPFELFADALYCVYQKERGEKEGTVHLQGYVEFKNEKRLSYFKKRMPRAHVEKRRGTRVQARAYCMKEDTRIEGPFEYGYWHEPKGKGHRSDLDSVRKAIRDGKSEIEIADDFFSSWVKYRGSFREYKGLISAPRSEKTQVICVIGPTGTGKSSSVRERSPSAYWKQPHSEWWDGYDGTSDVVLDDFYGWIRYESILRLLDRYPLTVQCKGGQINFNPRRIFITSNKWPDNWYDRTRCPTEPLLRRIDRLEWHGSTVTFFGLELNRMKLAVELLE